MPVVLQDACDENINSIWPGGGAMLENSRSLDSQPFSLRSMAFIDGTVVNVALPALQTNLNATATDVQWVIESYALFLSLHCCWSAAR